jgi:hypothetical protein
MKLSQRMKTAKITVTVQLLLACLFLLCASSQAQAQRGRIPCSPPQSASVLFPTG